MKKRIKLFIIALASILIIAFIVLAIINYIVLPPKVSANAQKYKYNQNNMLNLKSITVDGNKVIYEFSSLNKFFHKNYIRRHGDETAHTAYLELFKVEDREDNSGKNIYPIDYTIISSITSNYLVITLEETDKYDFLRCHYLGGMLNKYSYLCIALSNLEGYENLEMAKGYDYPKENRSVSKSQSFDSKNKRWSKIKKRSGTFSTYK